MFVGLAQDTDLIGASGHAQGQVVTGDRDAGIGKAGCRGFDRQVGVIQVKVEIRGALPATGIEPAPGVAQMDVEGTHQELTVGYAQAIDIFSRRRRITEPRQRYVQGAGNRVRYAVGHIYQFGQREHQPTIGRAEGVGANEAAFDRKAAGQRA